MILRKKVKFFSAILLIFTVLFSNHADLTAFSAVLDNSDATTESTPPVTSDSGDKVYVLGGIRPEYAPVSECVYVFNMDTDIPVYSKNIDKKIYPASTAKIMTALVTLENANLDDKVVFDNICNDEFWSGDPNMEGAAVAGFDVGQNNLTIRDALYGMMLPSGCEAANILAYNVGTGAEEDRIADFVKKMNDKARELGCKNTNFTNPHGLFEPDNYSTPYDMFLIAKYAYDKFESFKALVSSTEFPIPISQYNPDGVVVNTNLLLKESASNPYYYEFAKGIKTGGVYEYFTQGDGAWNRHEGFTNLISIADCDAGNGRYEYMILSFNAPWKALAEREDNEAALHYAYLDHKNLYSWAFTQFEYTCVMQKTEPIEKVTIIGGEADSIKLYPRMSDDFWTLLPTTIDKGSAINRDAKLVAQEVEAPVDVGAILGTVELILAGQSLGKWDLYTVESVEKTIQAETWDKVRAFFYKRVEKEVENPDKPGETMTVTEERLKNEVVAVLVLVSAFLISLIIFSYIRRHNLRISKGRRKPPNRRIRR